MKPAGLVFSFVLALAAFTAGYANDWTDSIFDEKDYIGVWNIYEPEGLHAAFLYKTGIRLDSRQFGTCELKGHWQGSVFFSADSSGKDVETARFLDDGTLRLRAVYFAAADTKEYLMNQVVAGRRNGPVAVAPAPATVPTPAADPGPKLAWPPPKGTITIGMTKEDLEKLPWHRDGLQQLHDNPRAQVFIYTYHCDDPTLIDLTVTVKNGHVVTMTGGNG